MAHHLTGAATCPQHAAHISSSAIADLNNRLSAWLGDEVVNQSLEAREGSATSGVLNAQTQANPVFVCTYRHKTKVNTRKSQLQPAGFADSDGRWLSVR
jgi:hypothetical protein